jgi:hypothetical protein
VKTNEIYRITVQYGSICMSKRRVVEPVGEIWRSADEGECALWVSIGDMDMLRLRQLI